MKSVLILIPTYNESENIENLLSRLVAARINLSKDYAVDFLVIDDSSPDKTAQIAKSITIERLSVLIRDKKTGLGPAYLAGFKQGLTGDYDYFVEMDADLSHQPEQLINLLHAADEKSLVIGTRWMPGGSVVNWPARRKFISRVGTWYASFVLKLPYQDLTSGFRVLPREFLEKLNFNEIETRGYGFQIEMALKAVESGFEIKQVPITFVEREYGRSKMSLLIVLESWLMVSKYGFKRISSRR
jgi:dolichol-phosphate mannosyltransferase